MSSTKWGLPIVALVLVAPAWSQARTVYMIGVGVDKEVVSPPSADPQYRSLDLQSNLLFFNNGTTAGQVARVAGYGVAGPLQVFDAGPYTLLPGQLGPMSSIDNASLEVGKYEISEGILASPTLELVHASLVGCQQAEWAGSYFARQGRIPLPVFEGLFPAGTGVACGDVVPFNPGPADYCGDQKYVRRINLTLFNGGLQPATFTVKVIRAGGEDGGVPPGIVVFNSTFGVPAETVQQFNSVYAPAPVAVQASSAWSLFFTITADQPFLAYVSTTFENPQPGAIPYEIFPARLR